MQAFVRLLAVAAPLDRPNVDTDQIVPARFLRKPRGEGYAAFLFHDLRFDPDGSERPDFVLNRASYRNAKILVADRNFGGGSSRESAVWALLDYGIRCVIASSFGDIFYNNALKNGLLPARLESAAVRRLRAGLRHDPGARIKVNLEEQLIIAPDGSHHGFPIDSFSKHCLLHGLNDIGVTLDNEARIASFEKAYRKRRSWLFSD